MRMPSDAALRSLVRSGANLELDARDLPMSLACELLEIGSGSTFTFLAADDYPPATLERLAFLGHSRVTFRFQGSDARAAKALVGEEPRSIEGDGFKPETPQRLSRPAPTA